MTSKLKALAGLGQAVWLDFVDRKFLADGGRRKLIREGGRGGVTASPSIFGRAIGRSDAYDAAIEEFLASTDAGPAEIYESLAIADIKAAAADLRPVYGRCAARDGYVSLEVSPYLADRTENTIREARRLWASIGEPNLMVKVPGTAAGIAAIRQLIEDGINVNVTLLFELDAYKQVADAYLAGLEARVAKGESIDRVASVASFFVSRIDTAIDKQIDARLLADEAQATPLWELRGKLAIANAKLAYAWYRDLIASDRWQKLAAQGAMPQRLLWASTGTKDPAYRDTLYIDALIGPDTVNTMPLGTMDAFRDHGSVHPSLTEGEREARDVLTKAENTGLGIAAVAADLAEAGVTLFADAFDALLSAVANKRADYLGDRLNPLSALLPEPLQQAVDRRLETARSEGWTRRLIEGDATLWTGANESQWLGWIEAASGERVDLDGLAAFAQHAQRFKHAVLLGMGGSSLGPEVIALILGSQRGAPRLHVLDTTDPEQIAAVLAAIEPQATLFIVSSKSGSTLEPELLRALFWSEARKHGGHFAAVTDPGSALEVSAKVDGFAHVFRGDPKIGGRYSVLSAFGMVPAAAIGLDVEGIYRVTRPMRLACGGDVPPAANPGVRLGAIIGEAALAGRDKLTIVASPALAPFGAWLEQLLAESTGKHGKGIVPVDLEPLGDPEAYGADRLFVQLQLAGDPDPAVEARLDALIAAGQPVVRIALARRELISQEFLRWEVATAIAGAVLGINPFDQPDVEAAKIAARRIVDAYERSGSLGVELPLAENDDLAVFGAETGLSALSVSELLRAHFVGLRPGDYVGLLAYLERNDANAAAVSSLRAAIRDALHVATVAGFGPRYLHSTGQAYKGGPAGGTFLTITRDPSQDLAVPGRKASFGNVQLAQARGDMAVLAERGRRVLRVHLKHGGGGIFALQAAVNVALATQRRLT